MKKQFVTYEIALKIKELGFDKPCFSYWFTIKGGDPQLSENDLHFNGYRNYSDSNTIAPLWQQAIDWLLFSHNLFIEVIPYSVNLFHWDIIKVDTNSHCGISPERLSYPETREQAILKALKPIKTGD